MIKETMTHQSKTPSGKAYKKGFSLVELLAVMTIIAILLSLASVGINKIGKGQGITAAMAQGEGMFAQARSLAMNQNTRARLIIHSDLNDAEPEDRERYRRMMMVLYKKTDDEGREDSEWTRAGSPVFLPTGVYFSPDLSQTDMRGGGELPTDTFQLSSQTDDTSECHYYEFNGQGICSTPGAGFVVQSGARPMNAPDPITGSGKEVGGFVILKNGGTTIIRDVDRLDLGGGN